MSSPKRRKSQRVGTKRSNGNDRSEKRYAEIASLEELRSKVRQAKSKRASLQADIARLHSAPTREEATAASTSQAATNWHNVNSEHDDSQVRLGELSQLALQAEERCILYRTTGWTVFEIDLDIGRRERAMRREQLKSDGGQADVNGALRSAIRETSDKGGLGLGVRLDTFWRGRFYEPYYLVFAKPSQLVEGVPAVTAGIGIYKGTLKASQERVADALAPLNDGGSEGSSQSQSQPSRADHEPIRLLRHTIPHFVPLQHLVQRFLSTQKHVRPRKVGGLELLHSLLDRQGLWAFLGHLHSHLQAFVARREQTLALSKLVLPSEQVSRLTAHGDDAFTHLSIRWDMPQPTEADVLAVQQNDQVLRRRVVAATKPVPPQKMPQVGDECTSVHVSIRFGDLAASNLGSPLSTRDNQEKDNERVGALRALSQAEGEQEGLACASGIVLVQAIRHRVPAPRRGGDGATTMESKQAPDDNDNSVLSGAQYGRIVRRDNWAQSFFGRDLDRALDDVLVQAWKEEMRHYEVLDTTNTASELDAARSVSIEQDPIER